MRDTLYELMKIQSSKYFVYLPKAWGHDGVLMIITQQPAVSLVHTSKAEAAVVASSSKLGRIFT